MAIHHVHNKSRGHLGLPHGPLIPPGGTVAVQDWKNMESNDVVQAWLKAGALEVVTEAEGKKRAEERARAEATATGPLAPVAAAANQFSAAEIAQTSGHPPIGATAEETGSAPATPSGPDAQTTDANDPAKTDLSKVGNTGGRAPAKSTRK